MKIAFFTDTYHPGVDGVVVSILKMSDRLAKRGHKILIFCPRYPKNNRIKTHKNITVQRSASISAPTYKNIQLASPNMINIIKELKRFNPDIIHMHSPGPMCAPAIIGSWMLKRPLVGTFHTLITEQMTYLSPKRLPQAEYINRLISYLKGLKTLMKTYDHAKKRWTYSLVSLKDFLKRWKMESVADSPKNMFNAIKKRWLKQKKKSFRISQSTLWRLLRIAYSFCNITTTPSPRLVKELKKQKMRGKIIYLSNGLDFSVFRQKKTYRKDKKQIITVGRVSYEKNIDVMIKSLKYVIKQYPDVIFTIIGDGPAEKDLKALTKRLNLEKNVNFTGRLPYDKLSRWYSESAVYASASTMETQGLTILEAMYCGLPIVGVNKYAIPDWVHTDENGYIVPTFNPKKMGEAIIKLLDDKKRREEFGKRSALIAEEHDVNKIVKEVEKMYASIIKKNSPLSRQ